MTNADWEYGVTTGRWSVNVLAPIDAARAQTIGAQPGRGAGGAQRPPSDFVAVPLAQLRLAISAAPTRSAGANAMPTTAAIARRAEIEKRKAAELHSRRNTSRKATNRTNTRGNEAAAAARQEGQQRLMQTTVVTLQAEIESAAAN
ncbi:hypothetical protein MNEG_9589, partial [Monoraphidium neglectum]